MSLALVIQGDRWPTQAPFATVGDEAPSSKRPIQCTLRPPTLFTFNTLSHGFQRAMLGLWNSVQLLLHVAAGFWPHATDTQHAHRIKTEIRMGFMTEPRTSALMRVRGTAPTVALLGLLLSHRKPSSTVLDT